jgi:hypothetical protein
MSRPDIARLGHRQKARHFFSAERSEKVQNRITPQKWVGGTPTMGKGTTDNSIVLDRLFSCVNN